MDIGRLLDCLEEVEQKMAIFYERVSELFSDMPKARDFFADMSSDERNHQNLVGFQRRIVNQNRELFEEVSVDACLFADTIESVDCALESLPLSLVEVLLLSIKLENSMAESHCKTALSMSNPDLGAFIKRLGTSDIAHREKLEDFVRSCD